MNKKTKVVPLRLPEYLDELAAFGAEEEHSDKATTLRQWIHEGAELYLLKLIEEGRLSTSRAAELLGVSIFDIHNLAERHGIALGATVEQFRQSLDVLSRVTSEKRNAVPRPEVP